MNGKNTSRFKLVAGLIGFVVIAAILLVLSHSWQQTVQVRTAQASYQDVVQTVSTIGHVEPVSDFQAHAGGPGSVENIYVHINQKVSRGQLLLRLDNKDAEARLAASRANLAAAEAARQDAQRGAPQEEISRSQADLSRATFQHQQAEQALAQIRQLQAKGAASAQEVAAAQQRVNTAQNNIDSIRAQMSNHYSQGDINRIQAQVADAQASVSAANKAVSQVEIHSPIAGTVYALPVSQYDYVPAGDELIKVADLTRMRVRAYFDEPDIGKLAKGQPVRIEWEAKPGRQWHGHIESPPTTVTPYGTRHVGEALITIDDADGSLDPYANVTVTVTTAQLHHVLAIPHEALRTEGASNYVFVVRDGRLVRTPIQIGMSNFTQVQVTGGLSDGDVVTLGAVTSRELTDGLRVTSVNQGQ